MKDKEDFGQLLDRYARGLCSAEESRRVERHILKNPVSGNWQWRDEEHRRLTEEKIRSGLPMLRDERRGWRRRFRPWMYAAAAVAVLGLGFWFRPADRPGTVGEPAMAVIAEAREYIHDEVTVTFPDGEVQILEDKTSAADLDRILRQDGSDSPEEVWLTVRVPSQRRQEITLADGSQVWLNAGAALRFPRAFAKDRRHVHLDGEGYFDIAPDAASPFRVFAGGGEIKVTGTAFNVQAFAERKTVRTSLVEGGLSFYMGEKEHHISPGTELITDTESGSATSRPFDIAQLTSWKDGHFTFDNLSLLEVMERVSRWYNVTVVANAKPRGKRIGGTFPMDLPLEELLRDLSTLSGAKFETKGKEVHIAP